MGSLKCENIKKVYGKKEVLKDVNLELESGKIYGLIGRNGVGKTTLLSILSSQNPAGSGRVTLDKMYGKMKNASTGSVFPERSAR